MAEIAAMDVSVKTAETYRAGIKLKFDIKERMQLLRKAVEWTLTYGKTQSRATNPDIPSLPGD